MAEEVNGEIVVKITADDSSVGTSSAGTGKVAAEIDKIVTSLKSFMNTMRASAGKQNQTAPGSSLNTSETSAWSKELGRLMGRFKELSGELRKLIPAGGLNFENLTKDQKDLLDAIADVKSAMVDAATEARMSADTVAEAYGSLGDHFTKKIKDSEKYWQNVQAKSGGLIDENAAEKYRKRALRRNQQELEEAPLDPKGFSERRNRKRLLEERQLLTTGTDKELDEFKRQKDKKGDKTPGQAFKEFAKGYHPKALGRSIVQSFLGVAVFTSLVKQSRVMTSALGVIGDLFGAVMDIFLGPILVALGPSLQRIGAWIGKMADWIPNMIAFWKEVFSGFPETLASLKEKFIDAKDAIVGAFEKDGFLAGISEAIKQGWELVLNLIRDSGIIPGLATTQELRIERLAQGEKVGAEGRGGKIRNEDLILYNKLIQDFLFGDAEQRGREARERREKALQPPGGGLHELILPAETKTPLKEALERGGSLLDSLKPSETKTTPLKEALERGGSLFDAIKPAFDPNTFKKMWQMGPGMGIGLGGMELGINSLFGGGDKKEQSAVNGTITLKSEITVNGEPTEEENVRTRVEGNQQMHSMYQSLLGST